MTPISGGLVKNFVMVKSLSTFIYIGKITEGLTFVKCFFVKKWGKVKIVQKLDTNIAIMQYKKVIIVT